MSFIPGEYSTLDIFGRLGDREPAFGDHAREQAAGFGEASKFSRLDNAAVIENQNLIGVGDR